MIRWYDYIAAVITADIILQGLLIGVLGTTFWHVLLGGALAGFTYRIWRDVYCSYRKNIEGNYE